MSGIKSPTSQSPSPSRPFDPLQSFDFGIKRTKPREELIFDVTKKIYDLHILTYIVPCMHVLSTGTEALFANLGYFSIRSIQVCANMI